jgi:hypothetical protein
MFLTAAAVAPAKAREGGTYRRKHGCACITY